MAVNSPSARHGPAVLPPAPPAGGAPPLPHLPAELAADGGLQAARETAVRDLTLLQYELARARATAELEELRARVATLQGAGGMSIPKGEGGPAPPDAALTPAAGAGGVAASAVDLVAVGKPLDKCAGVLGIGESPIPNGD
jgi:hypothetical protein